MHLGLFYIHMARRTLDRISAALEATLVTVPKPNKECPLESDWIRAPRSFVAIHINKAKERSNIQSVIYNKPSKADDFSDWFYNSNGFEVTTEIHLKILLSRDCIRDNLCI